MQMTHICITRGFRVPESQFVRKTSFQTRPNPPGDVRRIPPRARTQPENVDCAGARLSRGASLSATPALCPHSGSDLTSRSELPFWGHRFEAGLGSQRVSRAGSAGVLLEVRRRSHPQPISGLAPWVIRSFGFRHWSFPPPFVSRIPYLT